MASEGIKAFTKGIKSFTHLSPSNISSFFERRGQWIRERIFGERSTASPAMMRGTAIEAGVKYALLNRDVGYGVAQALDYFDADVARAGIIDIDGSVLKQRDMIAPSVNEAYKALEPYGVPKFSSDGRQEKISIDCRYGDGKDDVIEFIGYLDFVFEDVVVDLKSTSRINQKMKEAHLIQRAIYARAKKMPVHFCYVSPKKSEIKEDGDIQEILDRVKSDVRLIDSFLTMHALEPMEQLRLIETIEARSSEYSGFGNW